MKNTNNTNLPSFIRIALALLFAGGWIANLYKIITTGFEVAQWGGMEVARIIGIFVAPLGAVLGFF